MVVMVRGGGKMNGRGRAMGRWAEKLAVEGKLQCDKSGGRHLDKPTLFSLSRYAIFTIMRMNVALDNAHAVLCT